MKFLLILIQRLKYKINLDRKNYILKHIRRNKPKTILEIGVFNGAFAKRMLLNATKSLNENISYIGVDLFEDLSGNLIFESFDPNIILNLFNALQRR